MAALILKVKAGGGIGTTAIRYPSDEALAEHVAGIAAEFHAGRGVWITSSRSQDVDDDDPYAPGGDSLMWMPPSEGLTAAFDGEVPESIRGLLDYDIDD